MLCALILSLASLAAIGCGGGSTNAGTTRSAGDGSATGSTSARTATGAGAPATTPAPPKHGSAVAERPKQGSVTDSPGQAPSAGGMVAAANAICTGRSHELSALRDPGANMNAIAVWARRRAEIELRALGSLEKLTPPTGIAAKYAKLIATDKDTMLAVVKLASEARAGNAEGVRTAKERTELGRLRLLLATARTGLTACSATG